ncbi:MAG: hypothetical protein CL763_07285 [Chloroflexi bacterium]|nr:hypothetical protein [Chloroflexota bacterium]|tara:strand:+ start:2721 stop:4298 length:1578 start_codon:yes stop_codon:yes gene_type:complete
MKLYLIDFSTFPNDEDGLGYILRSIAHTNGDYSPMSSKTLGWTIFLSPFLNLVDSDNFLDYANTARIVSIAVSMTSIFLMYILARKFFPEKYSLVAACLFAFEPHLNYNSGQALSEPLYILLFMISFYFILSEKTKFHFLSFVFASIIWWVRWPGIIMLITVSIILFYNSQIKTKTFGKYLLCLTIFFLIASPMLMNRYDMYDDPFYFDYGNRIFTGEFATLQSLNTSNLEYTAIDYINDNGILQFIDRFLVTGIFNIIQQLIQISYPYLIILLPIGIFFSFRAFDQNQKFINANWFLIIITLSTMVVSFSVIPERRFLFYLFPFLIIFATIPIQRLIEYGLSTFSFTDKQKNTSLIIILLIIIILSSIFLTRYDTVNKLEQDEQIQFVDILDNQLSGKILDTGNTLRAMNYLQLSDSETKFRFLGTSEITFDDVLDSQNIEIVSIFGSNLTEFIINCEKENVKYLVIEKDNVTEITYPFLVNIFNNENDYVYLKNILDTKKLEFKKIHVKVFELDYKKFHELNS